LEDKRIYGKVWEFMSSPGGRIKVILAGVSGWTGEAVARGILDSDDLELVGAVSRSSAGQDVGAVLGRPAVGLKVVAKVDEALSARDTSPAAVFIDYTSAASVKSHVLAALGHGLSTVVGSSGLTAADFEEIDGLAKAKSCGVIACGNYSITAALAKHFALIAAKHLPHWEVIDYASGQKIDAPSGSARELAEELAQVRANKLGRPLSEVIGPIEARGAQIAGTPVHSIRLPGFVLSFETIFGLPNERLSIRHDAGSGAEPYVDGTLLAVRRVGGLKGLTRGLDSLLLS
jgi:4-hydroxy-tetrahydrodipicolinate reductase